MRFLPAALLAAALLPSPAPAQTPQPFAATDQADLALAAVFAGSNKPITSGLQWRVFLETDDDESEPVARSREAAPVLRVPQGKYLVHAAYGLVSVVRHVTVGPTGARERVTLAAGALKLDSAIGETPLKAQNLAFTIFSPVPGNSEGKLIANNVRAGEIVRLPEGVYHVVSQYGTTNAIRRADLRVETGSLTEATIMHRAATVTLKLVLNSGGEALAGTGFTVLTPGGDVIHEATGAFPSLILAEGEYILIARHEGNVYTRPFKVDSGLDRDIEALAR